MCVPLVQTMLLTFPHYNTQVKDREQGRAKNTKSHFWYCFKQISCYQDTVYGIYSCHKLVRSFLAKKTTQWLQKKCHFGLQSSTFLGILPVRSQIEIMYFVLHSSQRLLWQKRYFNFLSDQKILSQTYLARKSKRCFFVCQFALAGMARIHSSPW